jgi:hypothetical protein
MQRNHQRIVEARGEQVADQLAANRGYDAYDRSDYGYDLADGYLVDDEPLPVVEPEIEPEIGLEIGPLPAVAMPRRSRRGVPAELDDYTVDAFSPS